MGAVTSALAGQQKAVKSLAAIVTGHALPDELYTTLQHIRSLGDGEQQRAFLRTVQKAIEHRDFVLKEKT